MQQSAVISSAPSSAQQAKGGSREQFTIEEVIAVMSRFDIGPIEQVAEYARGSRKAPKLLITSDQGRFLLKRRARGRDEPFKVAFTHAIQIHLANKQFPLPHLVGTRGDNNSMLQWRGAVYELFEFIPGQGYPATPEAAHDGGHTLGLFHKLLLDFRSQYQPPTGSYHATPIIEQGLDVLSRNVLSQKPEHVPLGQFMTTAYRGAAAAAEKEGISAWPKRICHADWHPGNMLFRENRVAAVIDYDSARVLQPIVDIANGALQFAVIFGEGDVSEWPDHLAEDRYKQFLRGYEHVTVMSQAELRVIPWLMIEALIAEAVLPIATTGTFGRVDGIPFLQMIQRKVIWLQNHARRLIEIAAS
jgi:homoserine kinase type II